MNEMMKAIRHDKEGREWSERGPQQGFATLYEYISIGLSGNAKLQRRRSGMPEEQKPVRGTMSVEMNGFEGLQTKQKKKKGRIYSNSLTSNKH